MLIILTLGNYILVGKFDESLAGGKNSMEYHLVSEVQVEKGKRLFWPYFGFFYKAIATKISVWFYDLSASPPTKTEIINEGIVNPMGNSVSNELEWKYVSRNLSTVTQYENMVTANTEKSWQVES